MIVTSQLNEGESPNTTFNVLFFLQNEREQIMTTNVWLTQVSLLSMSVHSSRQCYNTVK